MMVHSGIEPFVATAERRSFRRAAAHLGISPAAISKAVARLEDELGVRLLHRTTRHVSLTAEGEVYLAHCREALDQLQAGKELVTAARQVPQGTLRLSVPHLLARPLVRALPRLLPRHPRLCVALSVTDRVVRLAEEGVDVAVRVGELDDSALVARKLQTLRYVTVAAPAYLARRGTPLHPDALQEHAVLKFVPPSGGVREPQFLVDGQIHPVRTDTPLRIDDGGAVVEAAVAGLGICQAFDLMVREPVADGALVEVLERYAPAGPPLTAVCLPGARRTPRVRAILDLLVEVLGER